MDSAAPNPSPDPSIDAPPDGLRAAILSGRFAGAADRGLASDLTRFLTGPADAAVPLWFGAERLTRIAHNPASLRGLLDHDIAAIDALISAQLDAILHHPRTLRLEGTWRGVAWLTGQMTPDANVKVKLFNASWREIGRDLEYAIEFDQSHMFRHIYEADFGTAGGEPIGLVLVDQPVRHLPSREHPVDDKLVLERLAAIGAAAFAPVQVAPAPDLLGVDSFAQLADQTDPTASLNDVTHLRWRDLADRPDSRFLAVILPRVLARPPWPDDGGRGEGFRYAEHAPSINQRVWMSGTYAFAAVAARAFAQFGWPADVRGADPDRVGGGLVNNLPNEPFRLSATLSLPRRPTETLFLERQERALIRHGLLPLSATPYGDELLFGAVRSQYRPARSAGPADQDRVADDRVASQINAVLCASRFAHCIKARGRQMIGTLSRPEEIEERLRTWLMEFVNTNAAATADTRSAHPLVGASVKVREQPDNPGVFHCSLQLQPFFQIDSAASFDFETQLTKLAA